MSEEIVVRDAVNEFRNLNGADFAEQANAVAEKLQALDQHHLALVIREWHSTKENWKANYDQSEERAGTLRHEFWAMRDLRNRDLHEAEITLQRAFGDATPFELDNAQVWGPWFDAIVVTGIYTGHASEVHRLMLDISEFGSIPADSWERKSQQLRDETGAYPTRVGNVRAVAEGAKHYQRVATPRLHPADPRLARGWEIIWHQAKRSGLCDVWDDLAREMGVPEVELPTRGGTVTVRGSFSVEVNVSGVPDGESPDIEIDDLISEMGYYDVEIEEIDDSELSYE